MYNRRSMRECHFLPTVCARKAYKEETSIFELIKYFTLILFHGAILI